MKQFLLKNSSYIGTILNKRIALATQLSVEPPYSSEDFQVANYGVGGQYGIHSDAFDFTDVFASSDTDVIKHYERNTGNDFLYSFYSLLFPNVKLNNWYCHNVNHKYLIIFLLHFNFRQQICNFYDIFVRCTGWGKHCISSHWS